MGKLFSKPSEKARRQALRGVMPHAEVLLWLKLKDRQIAGYKFRRQHSVRKYVLDFYCSELNLCIEVDGDSHFIRQGPAKDKSRSEFLEARGIYIIRFANGDVYKNIDGVVLTIEKTIRELEDGY